MTQQDSFLSLMELRNLIVKNRELNKQSHLLLKTLDSLIAGSKDLKKSIPVKRKKRLKTKKSPVVRISSAAAR
jgi:hypothetical protein